MTAYITIHLTMSFGLVQAPLEPPLCGASAIIELLSHQYQTGYPEESLVMI
jgi:hypothetical protein